MSSGCHLTSAPIILLPFGPTSWGWWELESKTPGSHHPSFTSQQNSHHDQPVFDSGQLCWLQHGADNAEIASSIPIRGSCTFLPCRGLHSMILWFTTVNEGEMFCAYEVQRKLPLVIGSPSFVLSKLIGDNSPEFQTGVPSQRSPYVYLLLFPNKPRATNSKQQNHN